LWPALAERFESAAAAAAPLGGSAAIPPGRLVPLRRLRDGWRPAELAPAARLPHLPLGRTSLDPPEFSWVGETQRHVGTVVHAFLARLASSAPLPTPEDLEGWRDAAVRRLKRAGVPDREQGAAAGQVLTALARTVADERGRWTLAAGHREAASELAVTGLAGGRLRSVVIDRCFVDETGTRWVIDYKTSRHEGSGLESFLAEELERYRAQLSTYVALAQQLGPQPVRAALYFPLLGAFRELS
jgi:ATP-dependent exoDNAse (exonuclease V) beta subunit